MLWRHKSPFQIYKIHDSLLGHCSAHLIEFNPNIITQKGKDFLEVKGILFPKKEYSYIQIFVFKESITILPKFVTDRLLIFEICR